MVGMHKIVCVLTLPSYRTLTPVQTMCFSTYLTIRSLMILRAHPVYSRELESIIILSSQVIMVLGEGSVFKSPPCLTWSKDLKPGQENTTLSNLADELGMCYSVFPAEAIPLCIK